MKIVAKRGVHPQSYFDPFCTCYELDNNILQCNCGDEYPIHDWDWDKDHLDHCTLLSTNEHGVLFERYIPGTVRGTLPFQQNRHYYWVIKILTGLYNAYLTLGVGTKNMLMDALNLEGNYWKYSNWGYVGYGNGRRRCGPRFGKGSIIGVHLDTCNGTLEFYNNRRPLGMAFTGLKGTQLYPMVRSSSYCQAAIRLTCALSVTPNLQLLSLLTLRENTNVSLASIIDQMPGLRNMLASRFWWLMGVKETQQHEDKHAIVPSPSPLHETGPSSRRKRKRQRAESSSRYSNDDDE